MSRHVWTKLRTPHWVLLIIVDYITLVNVYILTQVIHLLLLYYNYSLHSLCQLGGGVYITQCITFSVQRDIVVETLLRQAWLITTFVLLVQSK
jgi:hypothetical protein